MLISAVQKHTLLDYPEKVACIAFTPGCDFRCGFCHNPEFVLPDNLVKLKDSWIKNEAFFNFIDSRTGFLDGVVISGGEPTLQPDLLDFVGQIKKRGLLVKLDTNGNHPEMTEQALKQRLIDYIAMDVKTSLDNYPKLCGQLVKPNNIKKSIDLIKNGDVEYEFRTTLIKEVHSEQILAEMGELLNGVERLYLQTFRPGKVLHPNFEKAQPFTTGEMGNIARQLSLKIKQVRIR